MKLFPTAVIYLESALLHYGYTDRIPATRQIAIDKNISKSQLRIGYPPVTPFYLDGRYIDIGKTECEMNGTLIRIFDRTDRLRYFAICKQIGPRSFQHGHSKVCER